MGTQSMTEKKTEDKMGLTSEDIQFIQNLTINTPINVDNFDLNQTLNVFDRFFETNLIRLRNHNLALLFSGGLDSSLIAFKLNQLNIKFQPILVARPKEIDHKNAVEAAKLLHLELQIIEFDMLTLEAIIPSIMRIINTTEEKQINISVPFYLAAEYLHKNQIPLAILGQGADELFCGYQRYVDNLRTNPTNFKKYHLEDIKNSVRTNFSRDHAIFTSQQIGVYLPYLDPEIVKLTLSIPNHILIPQGFESLVKKNFLRLYAQKLGLDDAIIYKKKMAIQFGSGSYRLLRKLALKEGFTKHFAIKYGYLDNTQLYLDYIAQKMKIKQFDLKIPVN